MLFVLNRSDIDLIADYVVQRIPYSEEGREAVRKETAELYRAIFQVVATITLPESNRSFFEEERSLRTKEAESHATLQAQHIKISQSRMLAAVESSLPRDNHVCIVGPDSLEKGLMRHLAYHFSRISLVGASLFSLEDCARAIPSHLNRPVDLVCCDLTGVFQQTKNVIHRHVKSKSSFEKVIEQLSQLKPSLLDKEISSIGTADYVVSSLVISQLSCLYIPFLERELTKYWPLEMAQNTRLFLSEEDISRTLQTQHLLFLHQITKDHGCVYLSDTVQVSRHGEKLVNFHRMKQVFAEVIPELFTIISRNSWQWRSRPETTWVVQQYILKKNPL